LIGIEKHSACNSAVAVRDVEPLRIIGNELATMLRHPGSLSLQRSVNTVSGSDQESYTPEEIGETGGRPSRVNERHRNEVAQPAGPAGEHPGPAMPYASLLAASQSSDANISPTDSRFRAAFSAPAYYSG